MAGAVGGGEGWQWSATSSIKNILRDLLTTGFQSDLTIVLGANKDKEVGVHKIILQCRSRVLHSKILKCGGGNRLELEDVEDYASFMKILKYLYTGDSGATITEALPLQKMATDFEVIGLVDQCAKLLQGEITEYNVLQLFEDAMKYVHKSLIGTTLKFICCNASRILKLPGFSNLRLECLIEIIQQDDLRVRDEMEVFNAVYEWGQAESVRQRLDSANNEEIRVLIAKPLKYVRFPLMDKDEFVLNVATKELLSEKEVLGLLMCFVLSPEKRPLLPHGRFISTPRNHHKVSEEVWQLSRRKSTTPLCFTDAKTCQETLRFAIVRGDTLKLKAIAFPQGILPSENAGEYTWDPGCGRQHKWRTPFQVDVILFEGDEKVKRTSQVLFPSLLNGDSYHVPFLVTLEPRLQYTVMAKFNGKSYCYKSKSDIVYCCRSPLDFLMDNGLLSRNPLRSVTNFDNTPVENMDVDGQPVKFEVAFGRDVDNTMPMTDGFIEGLVFEAVA